MHLNWWMKNRFLLLNKMESDLKHSGVLILRLEDANGEQKAAVVKKILSDYADMIQNKFCVFQDERLRIKK